MESLWQLFSVKHVKVRPDERLKERRLIVLCRLPWCWLWMGGSWRRVGRHKEMGDLPAHLRPTTRPTGGLDSSAGAQSGSIQCAQTVQVGHYYHLHYYTIPSSVASLSLSFCTTVFVVTIILTSMWWSRFLISLFLLHVDAFGCLFTQSIYRLEGETKTTCHSKRWF